ncbi:MAG: bifunctional enoyl-CoA hydratase/phosphate acetyltransferase [Burkholderiaceae bacterium]|nr:bifunctional enoyl-CoA hydratase/phosphate acetyltransferase [Burkholderiaceae bacterium]
MEATRSQEMIENHTFDEIKVGDCAQLQRTLRREDIQLFAAMSGDVNPAHVDPEYANSTQFHGIIAHGMWGGALISTVLGTQYPGPGTIYLSQSLRFERPVHVGDTLTVKVTVLEKQEQGRRVSLDCVCTDQHGEEVISGTAFVMAPSEKVQRPRVGPLEVRVSDRNLRYQQLLDLTKGLPPLRVAVVHPCSEDALRGALEAAVMGLITPVLVGPQARLHALAGSLGLDLGAHVLVDAPHSHAAAACAVAMASRGEVQALMKGSLHTDELMLEVLRSESGLRTARRVSHVFVLDVPSYPKPLMISDAAINVEPDLEAKRDIVQNAIDLAHALGLKEPRVAILAAVETVNAKMRSTLDAAALCKMADRGQIQGGIVDGPLAFDNAISAQAAHEKGIVSRVAGVADILIAPDLEAGNMISKQLQYLADAQAAGIVLGAKVPVILTSRADGAAARVASCALALLLVKAKAAQDQTVQEA